MEDQGLSSYKKYFFIKLIEDSRILYKRFNIFFLFVLFYKLYIKIPSILINKKKYNQNLIIEKDNVLKDLATEKGKITNLNKEKDDLSATVQKGSILSCFNVSAKGVKFKSGGKKDCRFSSTKNRIYWQYDARRTLYF